MPRKLTPRAKARQRAVRLKLRADSAESRARIAAAKVATATALAEVKRIEHIALNDRLHIAAKAKAERDAVRGPRMYSTEARDIARDFVQSGHLHMAPDPKHVAHTPPAEPVTVTRVDDSTGRITKTPVLDRDSRPLLEHPAARTNRKQPSAKELAARHASVNYGGMGGFADPYGLVTANIHSEQWAGRTPMRIAGRWPG